MTAWFALFKEQHVLSSVFACKVRMFLPTAKKLPDLWQGCVCVCIPQLGTQHFSALWFQSTPYDTQCLCPRYCCIFHSRTLNLTLKSTAAVWLQQTSHSLTCNLQKEEKRNLETIAEGVDQKQNWWKIRKGRLTGTLIQREDNPAQCPTEVKRLWCTCGFLLLSKVQMTRRLSWMSLEGEQFTNFWMNQQGQSIQRKLLPGKAKATNSRL